MSRPLAKMSDDEFLRYLRQSRSGKGKTLAEVFENEAEALERRCVVLTLANVLRMLERPIVTKEWWAPTRIHAYVDASRVSRFKRLTGAREDLDGRLVVETGFASPGPHWLGFTPKEPEAAQPIVWWGVEHVKPATAEMGEARVEHEALGLYLTSTSARDETTWNTHAADHFVWQAHSRLTWARGPLSKERGERDGEPRAVIVVKPRIESRKTATLPGESERHAVSTPWGEITAGMKHEIDEIVTRCKDYGFFSIEVPVTVPSLGE